MEENDSILCDANFPNKILDVYEVYYRSSLVVEAGSVMLENIGKKIMYAGNIAHILKRNIYWKH